MTDPRVEKYAQILVDWCLRVEEGWEVVIQTSPLARPLHEEVVRQVARKGAFVVNQASYDSYGAIWIEEAPMQVLEQLPKISKFVADNADAFVLIQAPENTRELSTLDPQRIAIRAKAQRPLMERRLHLEVPWVGCNFPVPALAQEAGMSLATYEDFLYGACLLDWKAEGERMRRYADLLDNANEVRIVGEGTDITLGLSGRNAVIDDGRVNMPGGEFFYGPVEDVTTGVVTFSEFPALLLGNEVRGIRLEFKDGRVVDASAESGSELLEQLLGMDEGAKVVGELGIGCNPRIDRYMKSTLYDEKIQGTVHFALGASIPVSGGVNESSLHWDIVKDLRAGGKIYADGKLVQEEGRWLTDA